MVSKNAAEKLIGFFQLELVHNEMADVYTQPRKQLGHHITKQFEPLFKQVVQKEMGVGVGHGEFVCWSERAIPDMKECPCGDFPNNISKWIWSSKEDEVYGDFWQCIVELAPEELYKGKRYAYFQVFREGECRDETCFKMGRNTICDESDSYMAGNLLVVSDIRHIIEFLAPGPYQSYMKETEPAEEW